MIDIICKDLQSDFRTGEEKCSIEISRGVAIQGHDIATTHEEANNTNCEQEMQAVVIEQKHVTILADDTDVYALLLHHYLQQGLQWLWNLLLKRER